MLSSQKQKFSEFLMTYYAEPLREAGFVTYKNEGIHWYKVENDLLYKVHLPIFAPRRLLEFSVCCGVIPLFTWEKIGLSMPQRDWPGEMRNDYDHVVCFFPSGYGLGQIEERIGDVPIGTVQATQIAHELPNGLFIQHPRTERCGAELMDEIALPYLNSFHSAREVYEWNRQRKIEMRKRNGVGKTDRGEIPSLDTKDVIQAMLSHSMNPYGSIYGISHAFSDECLYFRDEELYPVILKHMRSEMAVPYAIPSKYRKIHEEEVQHARVLVSALERGDLSIFDREAEQMRERMLLQIKKQLPDLVIK